VEGHVEGPKVRLRAESFADHYTQARMFFRSQNGTEQAHLIAAIVFELSKVTLPHVRVRVLANLRNVDEEMAARVAGGLEATLPEASSPGVPAAEMALSPAITVIGKYPPTLEGRAVGILLGEGADGTAVDTLRQAAVAAGASVKLLAQKLGGVVTADGAMLAADAQLAGSPSVIFDAVAILTGESGAAQLAADAAAVDFTRDAFGHLKAIGFSTAAAGLLEKAGVVADAGIVELADGPAHFLAAAATRQWAREPMIRPLP
jgi:catalase